MTRGLPKFVILLIITLLLISGCWGKKWDPNEEPTPSKTFGFSQTTTYIDNKIGDIYVSDKNEKFTVYVFVTNGNKDMNEKDPNQFIGKNIKISLIDLDANNQYELGEIETTENIGYGKLTIKASNIDQLSDGLKVKLRAEGEIYNKSNNNSNGKGNENAYSSSIGFSEPFYIYKSTVEAIKIEPESKTIDLGNSQSFTVKAKYKNRGFYQPEWTDVTDKVIWKSSNPAIASMKNNVAHSNQVGTTDIIAKLENFEATAKLTINNPKASSISQITISPSSETIYIGEAKSFSAYGKIGGKDYNITNIVNWSSSHVNVASMSGFTATGIGAGRAVITASYGNGVDKKSATAELVVRIPVKDIPQNERLIWEKEIINGQ